MNELSLSDRLRHISALCQKECRQILRDKSALLLGIVLPLILIVLFGYGLSFDIAGIRFGIVDNERTAQTEAVTGSLSNNKTFSVTRLRSRTQADSALETFDIEALLVFEKVSGRIQAQLLVNGIDAPRANMVSGAVMGAVMTAQSVQGMPVTGVQVVSRVWFNESVNSRWYLVPGLFVIVLTLTGCMMTSLVVAREWERGTMEALLATPVSPMAFLLSKSLPYFVLGMCGWGLCMGAALILYGVPIRGSLTLILISSALYLLIGLGLGLVISGVTRSQFLASQITVLVSFLPAVILSGFIFDLRSAPHWADVIAHLLPPVYFLELLKVGFLTGAMTDLVIKNLSILLVFAVVIFGAAYVGCRKRLRS